MCDVLDRIENRGIEKGRSEGYAEGKRQLPPTKVGGLKAPKKEKSIFGDLQLIQIQQARYRSAKSVVEASQ